MKLPATFLACAVAGLAALTPRAAEPAPAPQRTTLESAFAEFWSVGTETFFVFNSSPAKRVTLVGTNLRIVCDHLEMTAVGVGNNKDAKSATLPALEKFKYLLATGNVHIVQGDREARAGRAEVFPREDRLELTEKPVVTDHGGDVTKDGVVNHTNDSIGAGSKIIMLRGQRKVQIIDSEFSAPEIKDLGFDKKEPVPTSKAPDAAPPAPKK